MRDIIIITGATASGKSAYAIQLARQIGGAIINADAIQLYVDAPILTAQPTMQELEQVEHHLYGVLQADDVCNVARYIEMLQPLVHQLWELGKTPILTGGTGMYLKAMMQGIAYVPEIAPEIRANVRALCANEAWEMLQAEDEEFAQTLMAGDTQRISRGLEVIRSSGKSLLWWQAQPMVTPFLGANFRIIITEIPRDKLYERINSRYINMVNNGGIDEAKRLHSANYEHDLPLMRAVGVRQLLNHLRGDYGFDEAITQGQAASRQYAKRQLTWIRNQWQNYEIAPCATQ